MLPLAASWPRPTTSRPTWLLTCAIDHGSKGTIEFPVIDSVAALLWVVNLGCIDLNQWYARCDDPNRPDYLHFDLDPGDDVPFARVAGRRSCFATRCRHCG